MSHTDGVDVPPLPRPRRCRFSRVTVVLLLSFVAACGGGQTLQNAPSTSGKVAYSPPFSARNFHQPTVITNPWFPIVPGATAAFQGEQRDLPFAFDQWVTNDTRVIDGVMARAVADKDTVSGQVTGGAVDYYAQDDKGNVWYMGEETTHYVNGKLTDHADTWISGLHGSRPGIIMPAHPHVGSPPYQQELAPNLAADVGQVVKDSESVCVPLRCFDGVAEFHETTVLDPGVVAAKYYAPGAGLVKESMIQGDRFDYALVAISPGL